MFSAFLRLSLRVAFQTLPAAVAVLPGADEIDIQINQEDLRIVTYAHPGPGGQCVNTTYSAVH